MFSFFKKKKPVNLPAPAESKPDWASFFDEYEYRAFITAVQQYFRHRKYTYHAEKGIITLYDGDKSASNHLGLQNVGQLCKQDEKGIKGYKRVITGHFRKLDRSDKHQQKFDEKAKHFDNIKQDIGVRLYHQSYLESIGRDKFVGKDLAGDLYAMIVFDLPEQVTNVQTDQVIAWNRSVDELFDLGLSNIRNRYKWNILHEPFNDYHIWFVHGEDLFATNIVFDLEQHPQLVGTYGSLIGIPHRHAVLIYPIENLEITQALATLVPAIHGMNEEGPGSLSNKLFWYKDGIFIDQEYNLEENNMRFKPTEDFLDMLNQLQEAPKQ